MAAGRKPKPTSLHVLEGTFRKPRHARRRLEPPAPGELSSIRAPEWMSSSQREIWTYAVRNAPRGVLKRIDREVMAVWVCAADRHQRAVVAQNHLDFEEDAMPGVRWDEHNKRHSLSPLVRVIEQAAKTMMRSAELLGFTPTARPRLAGAMGAEELDVPQDGPVEEASAAADLRGFIASRPSAKSVN